MENGPASLVQVQADPQTMMEKELRTSSENGTGVRTRSYGGNDSFRVAHNLKWHVE